jgi:CheY-like chemotaxis protein
MADILVIDDDPLICDMIEMTLTAAGHAVRTAGTGLGGLLATRRHKPDLILLDMGLPELDGYSVARELTSTQAGKSIPILAVTAHDSAEDYDASYKAGCTGFLAKPFTQERLLEAVAKQLASK